MVHQSDNVDHPNHNLINVVLLLTVTVTKFSQYKYNGSKLKYKLGEYVY